MENKTMYLSDEEMREFEEFRQKKAEKAESERRKAQRQEYAQMVDEELSSAISELETLSEEIVSVKKTVYDNFAAILKLKEEIMDTKSSQTSHTFTSSDGTVRLILGYNTIDGYRDTVEEGIAKVMEYIKSLAKDDDSRTLVEAVTQLLSRDKHGNIKASRVLQLRRMAERSGCRDFIDGVTIIEESYQPTRSKSYVKAYRRGDDGSWVAIPLSITDGSV